MSDQKNIQETLEANTQINSSKDYDLFIRPRWQRPVSMKRVKMMVGRMSKVPPEKRDAIHSNTPIIVTEKDVNGKKEYIILDGQHRFNAWVEMGEKIFFIIAKHNTMTHDLVTQMNCGQTQWSVQDSIQSYVGRNNEAYIWYNNLIRDNKLQYSFYNMFFSSDLSKIQVWRLSDIRTGQFNPSEEFRKEVEAVVSEIVALREVLTKDGVAMSDRIHFQKAYVAVRNHPSINFERTLKQFTKRGTSLKMRGSYRDMVQELVEILNYGQRVRIKIDVSKRGEVSYSVE